MASTALTATLSSAASASSTALSVAASSRASQPANDDDGQSESESSSSDDDATAEHATSASTAASPRWSHNLNTNGIIRLGSLMLTRESVRRRGHFTWYTLRTVEKMDDTGLWLHEYNSLVEKPSVHYPPDAVYFPMPRTAVKAGKEVFALRDYTYDSDLKPIAAPIWSTVYYPARVMWIQSGKPVLIFNNNDLLTRRLDPQFVVPQEAWMPHADGPIPCVMTPIVVTQQNLQQSLQVVEEEMNRNVASSGASSTQQAEFAASHVEIAPLPSSSTAAQSSDLQKFEELMLAHSNLQHTWSEAQRTHAAEMQRVRAELEVARAECSQLAMAAESQGEKLTTVKQEKLDAQADSFGAQQQADKCRAQAASAQERVITVKQEMIDAVAAASDARQETQSLKRKADMSAEELEASVKRQRVIAAELDTVRAEAERVSAEKAQLDSKLQQLQEQQAELVHSQTCVDCLEPLLDQPRAVLPCGHVYGCVDCGKTFLQHQQSLGAEAATGCPVCRAELPQLHEKEGKGKNRQFKMKSLPTMLYT